MDAGDLAFEYLTCRVVPLLLDVREPGTRPYPYTGFMVEIRGLWFWVTAAHCARDIGKAVRQYPNSTLAFISFANDNPRKTGIEACNWTYCDIQASIGALAATKPELGISQRMVDNSDVAFWPVPDATRWVLVNDGVKAICEAEAIPDDAVLGERMHVGPNFIFIAGIPEATHTADANRGLTGLELLTFSLHPDPDEHLPEAQRRVIESDGPHFMWIPTCWDRTAWDNSVVGVSGGPAIVVSGDKISVIGVVAKERGTSRMPSHVGVADTSGTLEMIKRTLNTPGETD